VKRGELNDPKIAETIRLAAEAINSLADAMERFTKAVNKDLVRDETLSRNQYLERIQAALDRFEARSVVRKSVFSAADRYAIREQCLREWDTVNGGPW